MSARIALVLSAATILAAGCSDSSAPRSAAAKPAAKAVPAPSNEPVAASAETFMRAILSGDTAGAAELLTNRAATRYAADPSVLTPMGMAVERFEVGQIRLLDEDEAAVQCLVTEPGASEPQELCCLLKLEPAGWRVCGLACDSGADEPTVISFEESPEPASQRAPVQFVEGSKAPSKAPRTAAEPRPNEYR
ncbi:hypothetical protein MalM25_04960 [Planctomycetes bacterium MalM25]|nr:hypothetical protein MalM25_04960 [Planctomycetes bacterium MalM25]